MFAPRPLSYHAPRKAASSKRNDNEKSAAGLEKKYAAKQVEGWRGFGWRPESFQKAQAERTPSATSKAGSSPNSVPSSRGGSSLPASNDPQNRGSNHQTTHTVQPSTPVAVPSRPGLHRTVSRSPNSQTHPQSSTSQPRSDRPAKKDPRLPASVASLLESTSIPKKTSFVQPRSTPTQTPRRMSTQQLMDEWKRDQDVSGSSLSGSPNLDFLLSSPPETDHLTRNESSESFDVLSRSTSSDSIPIIPHLDADESSELSWSVPSTPSPSVPRKSKGKQHPHRQKLTQDLDHPLSPPNADEADDHSFAASKAETASVSSTESVQSVQFRPSLQARKPSTFKSNLTASINSLRNSIRTSLSNFSAPSPYVLPHDHLSRGFFGPSLIPIRSEMRPRPLDGPPTPELRRYMNPSSYHIPSPAHDFHLHGHGRVIEHLDLEAAAATAPGAADVPVPTFMDRDSVIPLQTYSSSLSSSNKDGSAVARKHSGKAGGWTEAGRALAVGDDDYKPLYRRELRENGEFLRVCILEMNMRRAGKLADGPGRARLWLPPRIESESESESKDRGDGAEGAAAGKKIPKRWVGVAASY